MKSQEVLNQEWFCKIDSRILQSDRPNGQHFFLNMLYKTVNDVLSVSFIVSAVVLVFFFLH